MKSSSCGRLPALYVVCLALLLLLLLAHGALAKVHVHLVPHTHNDVGWLKTVDQYYMGSNKTYDPHAAVQYILATVIPALVANPERKFIYVEQGFFQRWWRQQTAAMQATVRRLVTDGQFEFINGGWCMHDEAAPHYVDMIDQTTLGHRYLLQQFNVTPTIGWQVDPFGHSLTQAALLGYDVGFDAVVLGRIDYQDKAVRTAESRMEFVWRGSPSATDPRNQIFAQATPTGGYNAPRGLCFDATCNDPPVQDDPALTDYNVPSRVDDFVAAAWEQSNHTNCAADAAATCNLMWLMGEDFQFELAEENFQSLDRIIQYVNQDGRVSAAYSTPTAYFAAKFSENLTWTIKADDFFPYASAPHSYWTGYFTSRPALKRMVRTSSSFLQMARQVEVIANRPDSSATAELEEAVAVSQHHDAVAGTSKQHVAYDYAQRLAKGLAQADAMVNAVLAGMVGGANASFASCPLLNVSLCATQAALPLVVLLYNPLSRSRSELVRLPVNVAGGVRVTDADNATVESAVTDAFVTSAFTAESARRTVNFHATVPPLGYAAFFLTADSSPSPDAEEEKAATAPAALYSMANAHWSLQFDSATGLLANVTDLATNVTRPLSQSFYYYVAGQRGGQNAGAYVLLPNSTTPSPVSATASLTVLSSGLVREARQTFTDWLYQTIRLEDDRIAFEWTVGELPYHDGVGREVITRYTSAIASRAEWYSDSNAREMILRVRDQRPTWNYTVEEEVAGNYVPTNAACGLNDTQAALFVLVDRAQGCTSMADGQLEFLLHRRLFRDDGKGLNEPLNETEAIIPGRVTRRLGKGLVVTGTHYVVLQAAPVESATNAFRALQSRLYFPLHVVASPMRSSLSAYRASQALSASFLAAELPVQVDLITLQRLSTGRTLVRFAHAFGRNGIDEGRYSVPVTLNLTALFARQTTAWEEVSLSANQKPVAQRPPRYAWNIQGQRTEQKGMEENAVRTRQFDVVAAAADNVVILPMEVRTFMVSFAAPATGSSTRPRNTSHRRQQSMADVTVQH